MPTHKRRNVETYGRKPRGNPPIRRTGSRLWDRRIHFLITRALAFGRQSRSTATAVAVFGIAGSSSKSSWIAGEWIFVLVIPRPWTTFLPVANRHVSNKFSLWTVRRGNRPGLRVHAAASRFSTFGPTEPSHCGSGKPPKAARPTASDRHGELPSAQVAGSRTDPKIVPIRRENPVYDEAHRRQIASGSRKGSHLSVPHWVRQTVSIAIPLNGQAT